MEPGGHEEMTVMTVTTSNEMTETEARELASVARNPAAALAILMGADRAAGASMAETLREIAFDLQMGYDARSDRGAR